MTEEKPEQEDDGLMHLKRRAIDFQLKMIRYRDCGKVPPPGGIVYYNPRIMLQATGDELQTTIANDLHIPVRFVQVKLKVESDKIIPLVNLNLPQGWIDAKGIKGSNPGEIKAMAKVMVDGVIDRAKTMFADVVNRRMQLFGAPTSVKEG